MARGRNRGHWEKTFIHKSVCQSEYINTAPRQHNTADLTDISFVPAFAGLSYEQCCLQTLITSTYGFALHRGGTARGTWIRGDANFLLPRHWQPQTAWRYNYWPFPRRTLFFHASGIWKEGLFKELSRFISVRLVFSLILYWLAWEKLWKVYICFPGS